MFKRFFLLITSGLLCLILFSGCNILLLRQGPPDRPAPQDHPESGTYYCDELKMSIDFTEFNKSYSKENYLIDCVTVENDISSGITHYSLELRGAEFYFYDRVASGSGTDSDDSYNPTGLYGTYNYKDGTLYMTFSDNKTYVFTLT